VRRWIPPLLALIALGLVPWAIWLTTVLPSHEVAEHWDLAWGGFDLLLAAALLATAVSAWRASPLLEAAAACTGTLLVVDAWFDLLTSSDSDLIYAIVLAVVAELPLAALCLWIVLDSETCVRGVASWRVSTRPAGGSVVQVAPDRDREHAVALDDVAHAGPPAESREP
jgi:hypothetical protein